MLFCDVFLTCAISPDLTKSHKIDLAAFRYICRLHLSKMSIYLVTFLLIYLLTNYCYGSGVDIAVSH